MITKQTILRNERIRRKTVTVNLAKQVVLSASELQRQRAGKHPEVNDLSADLAEAELRMRGEVVIVPAERMLSATAPVWLRRSSFVFMHVACLGVFLTGVNVQDLALCGSVYLLQMVGITVGYHRYLSHRAFKTSRAFQFVLAWLGCIAAQKGPLWWAAHHRHHHRTSDTPEDLHSPIAHSIWWAHVGWVLSRESDDTDEQKMNDLLRFPEMRWLDRYHWVPPLAMGVLCFVAGGWSGLVWGFFVSSVLSHHATFLVNSACHLWGRRRFATADASRNNWFVALVTLGEGWHNNHHHYQSSANQGFRWWELDVSYYLIRLLAFVGLVWDVRTPPPEKLISTGEAHIIGSSRKVIGQRKDGSTFPAELADSMSTEKVHGQFECSEGTRELQNSTATHLYRIAQEAISNAIDHGNASQVVISLKQVGRRISLEIADNGIGFDNTKKLVSDSPTSGIALRTMEYRASLIGGVIQFENRPEGGTCVRCQILHEVVDNG